MSDNLVFLDLETTGLDSRIHTITEIGMISADKAEEVWVCLFPEERQAADPTSLGVTGYNRIRGRRDGAARVQKLIKNGSGYTSRTIYPDLDRRLDLAVELAERLDGKILAGCNVKFDQEFLDRWMRRHGATPTWDYHVLDIPTYAAGVWNAKGRFITPGVTLGMIPPPFKTSKLSKAFAVCEPEEAHTALGDARWGKLLYETVQSEHTQHQ
jgi:DNA polymerase III epsilon subunit-like protein